MQWQHPGWGADAPSPVPQTPPSWLRPNKVPVCRNAMSPSSGRWHGVCHKAAPLRLRGGEGALPTAPGGDCLRWQPQADNTSEPAPSHPALLGQGKRTYSGEGRAGLATGCFGLKLAPLGGGTHPREPPNGTWGNSSRGRAPSPGWVRTGRSALLGVPGKQSGQGPESWEESVTLGFREASREGLGQPGVWLSCSLLCCLPPCHL